MESAVSTIPDRVSVEELDQKIFACAARIDAVIFEMLVLIREFDLRGCYLKYGLANTAEWLEYRCDYSYSTARDKVRVAHALAELPLIAEALASGKLSYTKAREMTRVANPDNEEKLLAFALRHSSRHVTEYCRELRFGLADSTEIAARAQANRSLSIRRNQERAMVTVTVELPNDAGALLEKALDKARDDECLKVPDLVDTSWSARQADAFTNMLHEYLAGETGDNANKHLVTIHVDQAALAGKEGRAALPIESVKRFLHIHHIEHWANGGETSLENLKLVCTKHHTLLHEGGSKVGKNFSDEWVFVRHDGIEVPKYGYRPEDMIEGDRFEPGEETFAPEVSSTRLELLSALERIVNEPPPIYSH